MGGILLILDGMTDRDFHPASLPAFHRLGAEHARGAFCTVGGERRPESLGCILALCGVPEKKIAHFSRGWIEALGCGVPFAPDDLLLRTTCVAVGPDGRIGEAVSPPRIDDPRYHQIGDYQGLLVLPGDAARLHRIGTHAPYENPGARLSELAPSGCDALLEFFSAHTGPDRALIPWGQSAAGTPIPLLRGCACVCATPVVRGIARALGADCITPDGATGDVDTDLIAKREAALAAAQSRPLTVLHLNGADEASHRGNAAQKADFLRRADTFVVEPLAQAGIPLLVCADHGAEPADGSHSGGLQPFVLANTARRSALGTFEAQQAASLLKE